jgi:hypothetical protein
MDVFTIYKCPEFIMDIKKNHLQFFVIKEIRDRPKNKQNNTDNSNHYRDDI